MVKQGASVVVPRLRFPEFRNAQPWKLKPFSQILTIGSGKDYKHLSSGPIPVYGSGGYMLSVSDYLYDGESACIGRKGTINNPIFLNGKFWTVDTLFYTHSFQGCLPRFVFLHFLQIDWLKHNEAGGIPSLSKSNIEKIEVAVPELTEQQKTADCLTSVDEVIAAQGRKVETLKAHKRGLMQQLFPREGETRPRLRFPEFSNAPEWEQKAGGVLFENRKEGGEEGLPIYSVTVNDGMIPRASFDRDFYDIEDPAKNKKACKGDIAYNMMRMWQGAQGVAVEDCMVSPAYIVLSPLEGVCPSFFAYLFKLPQSLELLTAYSRGLTKDRLRLYFDDFARMPLRVPGHEEQQRIADCLASLDAQITAESHQLAALKAHKQGLMQQLFPPPEAIVA